MRLEEIVKIFSRKDAFRRTKDMWNTYSGIPRKRRKAMKGKGDVETDMDRCRTFVKNKTSISLVNAVLMPILKCLRHNPKQGWRQERMKEYHEYKNKTEMGLDQFVEKMDLVLRQNQEKKGDSWKTCKIGFLEEKLCEETREYLEAKTPMAKANELIDVANVAMMLYNRYFDQWAKEAGKAMPWEWER